MNTMNELQDKIQLLEQENKELAEQKNAYIKKCEYLSKELNKANEGKSGHLSTVEIITDLALTLSVAVIFTIVYYTSKVHGEGFFELMKNAFTYIFN